jgi:hypothetical protein
MTSAVPRSPATVEYLQALAAGAPEPSPRLETRTPGPRAARGTGMVAVGTWLLDEPRILEGDAGIGKTRTLRELAATLATVALDPMQVLPVLISATTLAAGDPADAGSRFRAALAAALGAADVDLDIRLADGSLAVLIDSLDSAVGAPRARVIAALAVARTKWPDVRLLLASRPGTTDDVRALGFRRTAIERSLLRPQPDVAEAARAASAIAASSEPPVAPVPHVPACLVAVHPTTVAEFAAFVAAHGYAEPRWWSVGWTVRSTEGWTSPGRWLEQIASPQRPVVNVSWFEAFAYAAWLAAAMHQPWRLVSSSAWAAAATHPEGPYPWGRDEPTREYLNFDQNVGAPTPVGQFPRGTARGGHVDLAGNVWEWCADHAGDDARVVRGGGWYSAARYARADYHYGFHAANRFHDLGLRLEREGP